VHMVAHMVLHMAGRDGHRGHVAQRFGGTQGSRRGTGVSGKSRHLLSTLRAKGGAEDRSCDGRDYFRPK